MKKKLYKELDELFGKYLDYLTSCEGVLSFNQKMKSKNYSKALRLSGDFGFSSIEEKEDMLDNFQNIMKRYCIEKHENFKIFIHPEYLKKFNM